MREKKLLSLVFLVNYSVSYATLYRKWVKWLHDNVQARLFNETTLILVRKKKWNYTYEKKKNSKQTCGLAVYLFRLPCLREWDKRW